MKKLTRKLTISYSYTETQNNWARVPFIRLKGKWLEDIGFTFGQKIHVITSDKKVTIVIDDQNNCV